jgi:hypothetical protein
MAGKKGMINPNRGKGHYYQWLKDHVAHVGDECLIWPGTRNWNGYGTLGVDGDLCYAHRTMCKLVHGDPPTPKHVAAHSCHNGKGGCVHPKHVSWKTPRENLLERQNVPDMGAWSTRRTNIPPEDIAKIIELRGKMNQREIGKMFGISYQHVSVIQRGKLVTQ